MVARTAPQKNRHAAHPAAGGQRCERHAAGSAAPSVLVFYSGSQLRLERLKLQPSAVKEKATLKELTTICGSILELLAVDKSPSIFAGSSQAEQRLETVKQLARLEVDPRCSNLNEALEKILQPEQKGARMPWHGSCSR